MRRRSLGGWWVVGLLVAGSVSAEISPETQRAIVVRIFLDGPMRIDRSLLLRELPIQPGDALSAEKVEECVRWLQAKQIFDSVTADTALRDGRADLHFHLVPTSFVVAVRTRGARAIDEQTLLRRARIREDEPLSPQKIAAATARLRDLYAEQGYPDAEVRIGHEEESPGRARVTIRVTENDPVKIEALEIEGLDGVPEAEARPELPVVPGRVLARDALSRGRLALLRFLRGRSFYEAEVTDAQEVEGKRATLRYRVHLGPRFEIEVVGNREIATKDLLGVVDLGSRPIITGGTWQLVALRMKERYREDGFAFAEVSVTRSAGDPKRVRFEVQEGVKVEVKAVHFSGNRAFSDEELRGLMQNRPRSRVSWGGPSGVFREDLLAEDLDQIRSRYRSLGYLQAEVHIAPPERSEDQRWVTLTLEIAEGAPTVVGALEVEGAGGLLESPTKGIDLKPGAPFSPEAMEKDRRKLVSALSSLGYVDAEVTAGSGSPVEKEGRNSVDVHFGVKPNEQVRIGRVVIQQNYVTRDSVVRRALPFHTGDPLDPGKLAEGQSQLYRQGLFRSVSIEPLQTTGPVRDVAVRVAERPAGELQYGFGYDTRIGLRNFLQIGHKNLGGTGDQATLRGDINLAPKDFVPDEYILTLDGRHPRFWASPYDLRGTFTYQQTKRSRSIDEFSIRSFRFSNGFEREFFKGLRGSLLLEYEDADIFDVDSDVILTGKDTGRLRIVSLNPILIYDGRDDAFAPTRGVFDSLRVRYGSPAFGSDIDFLKLVLQHSQYVPLGDRLTWIYSGRFGVAEPFGSTTAIPLRERFFLGGRTTVRGFAENSIGPHGTAGHPAGGDLLFIANTELRFPLFYGFIGAVFADGGGLYFHDRAISIGEFRESVGPGLRYQTPIGALSLDYGFKIQPRRDESIGEVHFTIGNLF